MDPTARIQKTGNLRVDWESGFLKGAKGWVQEFLLSLTEERRAKVLGFIEYLERCGRRPETISCYLEAIKKLGTDGKPYERLTSEDLREWIHRLPELCFREGNGGRLAEGTVNLTKRLVKTFLRWCHNGESKEAKVPEVLEVIKYRTPKRNLGIEVLSREEVKSLLRACTKTRDRALVFVGYESGCRAGELLGLRLRDVEFDRYGAVLRVRGKTGQRRIRLVESVHDLKEWLKEHPYGSDPDAPLWISRQGGKRPITKEQFRGILQDLGRRAGIRKRLHPHLLRHTRATHLASVLTEAQMREYFGWTKNSDMPSVYVHLSGRDVDEALLRHYGVITEEEGKAIQELKPWTCPRCGEINSVGLRFCGRCGFAFNVWEAEEKEELEKRAERLQELLNRWLVKHAPELLAQALKDPEIRKELDALGRGGGGDH